MRRKCIIYILTAGCLLAGGCSARYESPSPDPNNYRAEENIGDAADSGETYDAVVTVKQTEQGIIYFQVDSAARLYPLNYEESYTGPKRMACRLTDLGRRVDGNKDWHLGYVDWFEDLARGMVGTDFDFYGDITPGHWGFPPDDGIDLLDDWMTTLEDAFLTIHYSSVWGDGSVAHSLMLIKTGDNEFRLLHYLNGDEPLHRADALVYFDLNYQLPQTEGMDINVKWTNGAGESTSKSFRFRSRP